MKKEYNPEEIAKEFEDYFGKTRGMTIAAFGLDMTSHIETASKVAFFAGYACGMQRVVDKVTNEKEPG